ncbi:hypothetical protein BD410DRAFT_835037 [Rickenella mellea]|uniref:Uncharacterized protein n=1 Tax=Rickenella mellea TaxID=50990 RepID=A0A4Y7QKW4_9AGAM|nr:hypothetical protein BD410DRAFT_835037 [Rickenella mellea]
MDGTHETEHNLRLRLHALEEQLLEAQAERTVAEEQLIATKLHESPHGHGPLSLSDTQSPHSHHAEENMRVFGRTDGVVFIEPQTNELPEECKEYIQQKKGFRGAFARWYWRCGIDRLISRPILHQWLENGKVVREAVDRQSSKFELFFDLLFVGMIHQISDAAAESPTGLGVARYVLTFCPAYSIWNDVRDTMNQFGSDDLFQRLHILWIMVLLVGYSNNASSIELVVPGVAVDGAGGGLDEETHRRDVAIRWSLGFFVVAKLSKVLVNVFYAFFLPLSRRPILFISLNAFSAALFFLIAIFLPLHWQIGLVSLALFNDFLYRMVGVLVVKLIELAGKKRTARRRNRDRAGNGNGNGDITDRENGDLESGEGEGELKSGAQTPDSTINGSSSPSNTSTSSTFGDETAFMTPMPPKGSALDNLIQEARSTQRVPAINIEHHVERQGAFVTIVLGEIIVNLFTKNSLAVGFDRQAGRSFLALMLAFNLNWLYFGSEACSEFIHALRRHWFTGFIFTYIHLPLVMSLLLASSAVNKLVISSDVATGLKYYFGAGIGTAVLCMSTIGVLHKRLDSCTGLLGVGRTVILGTRYVMGVVMILLPLAHARLDSIQLLGIYVGITAFLIAWEIVTRLEDRSVDEEGGR